MIRRHSLSALAIVMITGSFAAAQAPAPAGGQRAGGAPPAPMKNLQVLPKDTPQPQVVAMMRVFNTALGVNCDHCHVWTKPGDPTNDMAADTKTAEARRARDDADDHRGQHEARGRHQETSRSDCQSRVRDLPSRRSDSGSTAPACACG